MEELTLIIEERRKSIAEMDARQQLHKFQLVEEERKRNQRENWILRVLKSLKMLTAEQKRIIYETTHRIMTYYHPIPETVPAFQSSTFLEVMINLFVDFFNRFKSMDFTNLKAIIRPNNNYIVVDLLKTLLDLGRREFKNAMQDRFKEQPIINRNDKKLSIKSLVRLPPISGRYREETDSKEDETKGRFSRDVKLRYALLQKYGRAVENCNLDALHQRANQLYFDLIYLNQRNSTRIQKYLDACFGAKRHINYDASGLYTQEQIRKLVQNQQERASARISQIGQLRGECSAQQLKEYFKMQVEMHMGSVGLRGFAKQSRLQQWFPLCLIKNGDKVHPYQLVVDVNGVHLSIDQYELKYNKRVKVYMRQLSAQFRGNNFNAEIMHDPEYLKFPKKDFISYHQAKILEIINQDAPIMSLPNRKDQIFPNILTEEETCRKVKSQKKISNKSFVISTVKPLQNLQRELQKRMNYSSILKEGGQRKIDSIIEKLVRTKDIK